MTYPVLAANSTWFTPTNTSVKRANITQIEIMDSYTPDSSVTVKNSWDASAAKDGSITCYVIGTKLIMAGNGSGKIKVNQDGFMLFGDSTRNDPFLALTRIDGAELLDLSNTTSLNSCFWVVPNLSFVNISNWDVGSCTNMCNALCIPGITSLDLSNWNMSNVTDVSFLFSGCSNLSSLILPDTFPYDTVKSLQSFFASCNKLPVETICNFLRRINFENVDVIKRMFSGTLKYRDDISLDLSFITYLKDTDLSELFIGCGASEINLSGWNFQNVTSVNRMFADCTNLKNIITTSPLVTKSCTDIGGLITGCSSLTCLDTTNWDTSSVKYMGGICQGANLLNNFDVSNFDTSSCMKMTFMFYGCSSLGEIDVSNWNVSKVESFDHFAAHANLKRKGIENWKTTSATNMNALFHNCAEEELDLSGWDVSKNQFFCQMFENSPNLKRIKGLDKWDTSAGLGFDEMFGRCSKLEEVDLSNFNTSKAKNNVKASTNGHKTVTLKDMFVSCNNLKKVKLGPNFSINGDGTNTTAANKFILPTPSTDYIAGADGNWYAFNGDPYAPNAIPDRTADIYFASFPLCQDQDVIVKNGSMIDTAKAIREKNGTTTKYNPSQFGEAIRALN